MINDMYEIKEIREKLNSNSKISITDEEIINWYGVIDETMMPLIRRYRIFSICNNFKILLTFIFLLLFNSAILVIINSFGFDRNSSNYLIVSAIVSLIFWGGLFLLYLYISDYTDFISESVNKEIVKMRTELQHLLNNEIDLLNEGLKRNIFLYRKYYEKELTQHQKLFDKLSKNFVM